MNVNIRSWVIEDAEDFAKNINNKSILDNLRDGIPFPYDVEDAKNHINFILSNDPNVNFSWAIVNDDAQLLGSISVTRKENDYIYSGELGYYIAEEFWGKGVATEAILKACEYIFRTTDIIRIFALPYSRNIASSMLLKKCGFTHEGILRKASFKDGELINMNMYSLLKDDLK